MILVTDVCSPIEESTRTVSGGGAVDTQEGCFAYVKIQVLDEYGLWEESTCTKSSVGAVDTNVVCAAFVMILVTDEWAQRKRALIHWTHKACDDFDAVYKKHKITQPHTVQTFK